MPILKKKINKTWEEVSSIILNDKRLSFKEKGILFHLFDFPDKAKVEVNFLLSCAIGGQNSLTSGLRKLKEKGYLKVKKQRNINGTIKESEWTIFI